MSLGAAPRPRELLRWAIRIGRRRDALRPATLGADHARAERRLDAFVATSAAHPAGRDLQTAVKAWRTKFFVFLEDPGVLATNNPCEREIRPSVVLRKVTGGFRSGWGAQIHAGYRSVTGNRLAPRLNRAALHRPPPRRYVRDLICLLNARVVSS